MRFTADFMFPGDLSDAAARFAAQAAARVGEPSALQDAWRQAAAMGWPALLVDEAHGGAGGTLEDLGAVVEACARQALALPLGRRCALVPTLLMAAGTTAANDVLQALCAGEVDIDVPEGENLRVTARPDGSLRLDGVIEQVDADLPFTHVLVHSGARLLLLPQATLPAVRSRFVGIDGRRLADIAVDAMIVPSSVQLVHGGAADDAALTGRDLATLVSAIEMAATLGAGVEHCIEYLSTRKQFGVALSTFQVLRHKAVDMYVQYESASALLSRLVRDTVRSGQLAARDSALCKFYLNDLARRGAESSIQLHGGMGITAELPASRLACRLLCAEFERGGRLELLARLQTPAAPAHA